MSFEIIALLVIIGLLVLVINHLVKGHTAFVTKLNNEIARSNRLIAAKNAVDVQFKELCS